MTRLALASVLVAVLAACSQGEPPVAAEAPPNYLAGAEPAAAPALSTEPAVAASATPATAAAPSAAPAQVATAEPPKAAPPAAPAVDPAIAALPAPFNAAVYANGQRAFNQCRACHLIEAGGGNRIGPNLHGVLGRQAGAVDGFAYSPAMKDSGVSWTAAELDKYLTDPRTSMPGNRMTYLGIKDAELRRDLIGFLAVESKK